jgi:hypothetical protein
MKPCMGRQTFDSIPPSHLQPPLRIPASEYGGHGNVRSFPIGRVDVIDTNGSVILNMMWWLLMMLMLLMAMVVVDHGFS